MNDIHASHGSIYTSREVSYHVCVYTWGVILSHFVVELL